MAVATAVDFKREVKEFFALFDRQEWEKMKRRFSDDPQGVDEISRKWMRGKTSVSRYFDMLDEMGISDIHSKLSDFAIKQWDDLVLVTCVADQKFQAEGERVSITAPVSVLYRRIGGEWKIELVHAVALPDAA